MVDNTVISEIGICSEVLITLGARPISSFDENTDNALACSNVYPTTRDYLLGAHEWHHSRKRVVLSPDTTPPPFGWAYRFTLPSDCLRVLGVVIPDSRVDANGTPHYIQQYELEGTEILCNHEAIGLHYVYRNDVVTRWPAAFVHLMKLCLRWQLAMPITRDMATEAQCAQIFAAALKTTKAQDGQQAPAMSLQGDDFMEARY